MRNLLLVNETATEDLKTLSLLAIVVLAVIGVFAIVSLFAEIWKWVVTIKYRQYNKKTITADLTGSQAAEKLLEALGITDVKVEKVGLIKGFFVGNSYKPSTKTIRLKKNIYDKKSLTSVAIAAQKVAVAERHHEGDKKIAVRQVFASFTYFAPFAVLPLVLVGVILDFIVSQQIGILTVVFSILALLFYFSSFIVVCLNIPIEKRANKKAVEYFEKTNLLNPVEIEDAKDLYKTYITMYVLDFISELLYIIWEIAKFAVRITQVTNKKK